MMKGIALFFLLPWIVRAESHAEPPRENASMGEYTPIARNSVHYSMVDYLWKASDRWWHVGDYEKCIILNQYIIDLEPHFMDAYIVAAWLHESLGHYDDARKILEKAVHNNPGDYEGHFELGWFLYRRKDYDSALGHFRDAAMKMCPPHVPRMVGHTLEKLGRMDECLSLWQQLAKRYPDDAIVHHQLKRLHELMNRKTQAPCYP